MKKYAAYDEWNDQVSSSHRLMRVAIRKVRYYNRHTNYAHRLMVIESDGTLRNINIQSDEYQEYRKITKG